MGLGAVRGDAEDDDRCGQRQFDPVSESGGERLLQRLTGYEVHHHERENWRRQGERHPETSRHVDELGVVLFGRRHDSRLERQVAAQTEELRVQRAAIARTQRVLRTVAPRGDEEPSSDPVKA